MQKFNSFLQLYIPRASVIIKSDSDRNYQNCLENPGSCKKYENQDNGKKKGVIRYEKNR